MSALTSALDQMETMQLGENDSLEYGWSNRVQELIVQFYFQLVRTKSLESLKMQYERLLKMIFMGKNRTINLEYVKILYKMIGFTRDIVSGKGEYELAYMLVSELYNFGEKYKNYVDGEKIQTMAVLALESFVNLGENTHPYGSYKDLKYFCNYHLKDEWKKVNYNYFDMEKKDMLIDKAIDIMCIQLSKAEDNLNSTLIAKWIPRETSRKFGWITHLVAEKYFNEWFHPAMTQSQYKAAKRKALTHFRKVIAKLNKELNTPQVNQCNGNWREIDFDKHVTSITMRKQNKAFNMVGKNGRDRKNISLSKMEDRLKCKENYQQYLKDCRNGTKVVKGARVSIIDFVGDAIDLNTRKKHYNMNSKYYEGYDLNKLKDEIDLLNMQWKENSNQNMDLGNMIVMVDTSGSMECDKCLPLYSAIGLGIRIAEKSKLGKRIMTFNSTPKWVNLEGLEFVDMVEKIQESPWGMNTNFEKAFDLILDTAVKNNISPYEMKNFTLVICSDMQIDNALDSKSQDNSSMYDRMRKKYSEAGLKTYYKMPYILPHIVFWNLRKTEGFPLLSNTENASMISGNSPVLLNNFSKNGPAILKDLTPWKSLVEQLNNQRYKPLEDKVIDIWDKNIGLNMDLS